ncbi:MAG: response regulator [Treponema sp.]|nr:response regulator [Treponema sp.]
MDGLEATKAIRKLERPDAKTIPIIAMSAYACDEDIHKSLEAGMNDHIAKPVDPEKLYDSLVQQIISKDKQNAWNFSQVC